MIVGNGDIASVLPDRDDICFFAAGVSNSQEMREEEYGREYKLLMEQPSGRHLVYFSTLSVFYSTGRYVEHKKRMEAVVRENFTHWTIIRIGNITWGTNPHTIINFFRQQFLDGETPTFQDVDRYILDEAEFLHWIGLIPAWNCEMNVPGKRMKPRDIWFRYTAHLAHEGDDIMRKARPVSV